MPEEEASEGSSGYGGYHNNPYSDNYSPTQAVHYPKLHTYPIPSAGTGYTSSPHPYSPMDSRDDRNSLEDSHAHKQPSTSEGWLSSPSAGGLPWEPTASPGSPPPSSVSPSDSSTTGLAGSVNAIPTTYSPTSFSSSSGVSFSSSVPSGDASGGDHSQYGDNGRFTTVKGRSGDGSLTSSHHDTSSSSSNPTLVTGSHSTLLPFPSTHPPHNTAVDQHPRRRAWTSRSTPNPQDTPALHMFPRYRGDSNASSGFPYGHVYLRPESRASPPPLSPASTTSPTVDVQPGSFVPPKQTHRRTLTWGEQWSYQNSSSTSSSSASSPALSSASHSSPSRTDIGPGVTWQQVETERRRGFASDFDFGMDYANENGEHSNSVQMARDKEVNVDMAELLSTEKMGWRQVCIRLLASGSVY